MKLMKFFFMVFLATQVAWSAALDSHQRATVVRDKLTPFVLSTPGLNGIGVTGCDPETGMATDFSEDFVHCVLIYAETEEAAQIALSRFPVGANVDGVFVVVEVVGEIVPQPRMSGGN